MENNKASSGRMNMESSSHATK